MGIFRKLFNLNSNKNTKKKKKNNSNNSKQKPKKVLTPLQKYNKRVHQETKNRIDQHPPYKVDQVVPLMKQQIYQLQSISDNDRKQIIKIFWTMSALSNHVEPITSINQMDGMDFNNGSRFSWSPLNVNDGMKIRSRGIFSGDKAMEQKGDDIIKKHDLNPLKISRQALIDDIKCTIPSEEERLDAGIEYYLSQRVITSQDGFKKFKQLTITPITTITADYTSMGGSFYDDALTELKSEVVDHHGNGLMNLHDRRDDDDIDTSGTLIADAIKIKGYSLLKHPFPAGASKEEKYELLKDHKI